MSTYGRLPDEEKKKSEEESSDDRVGPDLTGENSLQLEALQEHGPGTVEGGSLLDDSDEGPVSQARMEEVARTLTGANQLPVGEMDPNQIEGSVPMTEGAMGVFDLGPDEQMNLTSAGFATCVGLLLERSKPDGSGKRAGFSHINTDKPDQFGVNGLIDQVGTDGLQAYLATHDDVSDQDATLSGVLSFLEDRKIPLAGRAVMNAPRDGSGNLMASLSGSGGPTFSSTTDLGVEGQLRAREDDVRKRNPAFEQQNALQAELRRIDAQRGVSREVKSQQMQEATGKAEKRYPMAFHPDGGEGCRGNTWKMPGRDQDPDGSGLVS